MGPPTFIHRLSRLVIFQATRNFRGKYDAYIALNISICIYKKGKIVNEQHAPS
jgi:hypothetical protein